MLLNTRLRCTMFCITNHASRCNNKIVLTDGSIDESYLKIPIAQPKRAQGEKKDK